MQIKLTHLIHTHLELLVEKKIPVTREWKNAEEICQLYTATRIAYVIISLYYAFRNPTLDSHHHTVWVSIHLILDFNTLLSNSRIHMKLHELATNLRVFSEATRPLSSISPRLIFLLPEMTSMTRVPSFSLVDITAKMSPAPASRLIPLRHAAPLWKYKGS